MTHRRCRNGVSLLELLVVLVVLGIAAGVSALALRDLHGRAPVNRVAEALREARSRAIRTGRSVSATARDSTGIYRFLALPDGRIVSDSVRHNPSNTAAVTQ